MEKESIHRGRGKACQSWQWAMIGAEMDMISAAVQEEIVLQPTRRGPDG